MPTARPPATGRPRGVTPLPPTLVRTGRGMQSLDRGIASPEGGAVGARQRPGRRPYSVRASSPSRADRRRRRHWKPLRRTLGIDAFGINAYARGVGEHVVEEHTEQTSPSRLLGHAVVGQLDASTAPPDAVHPSTRVRGTRRTPSTAAVLGSEAYRACEPSLGVVLRGRSVPGERRPRGRARSSWPTRRSGSRTTRACSTPLPAGRRSPATRGRDRMAAGCDRARSAVGEWAEGDARSGLDPRAARGSPLRILARYRESAPADFHLR